MSDGEYIAFDCLININLDKDPCCVKEYIDSCLRSNDISTIMSLNREDISPAQYATVQACQQSTASVDSSVSTGEDFAKWSKI